MSAIVTLDELKAATGCKRLGDLEKCLRQNGVRFLYGRNCIYTTTDALNAAMGLHPDKPTKEDDYKIELL
jgi:hypothetical protein